MAKMGSREKRILKAAMWTSAILLLKAVIEYYKSPKQNGDIINLILARLPPLNLTELISYACLFVVVYVILVLLHWGKYPNSVPESIRGLVFK
ncbi:MAG: hypothetical protein NTY48_03715 [Candidatus Diapherotrites archaeon]|nr:hypothetical protein [Candidatus Diapherotrites archaeon]